MERTSGCKKAIRESEYGLKDESISPFEGSRSNPVENGENVGMQKSRSRVRTWLEG